MNRPDFLKLIQRYVADVGITGSALRNQGAPGVVDAARRFLVDLDLSPLVGFNPPDYRAWLDSTTQDLLRALPHGAQNWGAARKALNIFMAHAFLNRELCPAYGLLALADVLETPLNDQAAKALRKLAGEGKLPKWPSIRNLTPEISDQYQAFAAEEAKRRGIPRACMDTILWRPEHQEAAVL